MSGENSGIRVNLYLAKAGLCSRRQADQAIAAGEVFINGHPAEMGQRVLDGDELSFRGRVVSIHDAPKARYIALNKPCGIVCTTDLREKNNIVDYMNFAERIFPIGRLDKDSSGLILLTNDGSIVNRILRAQYGHEKEYIVKVNKEISADFLQKMSRGVAILDTITKPCRLRPINETEFRIVLTQGLNRQIRRMCEALDYRVVRLKRTRIMHIALGKLQIGEWRELTVKELDEFERLLSLAERRAEGNLQPKSQRSICSHKCSLGFKGEKNR